MKSFSAILYVEAAVRSTPAPLQLPSAAWRTTLVTRLPTGSAISYVKQRPDTCGKRPIAAGMPDTPFSRYVFNSAPEMLTVNTRFPNGSTARFCPRVIRYGGATNAGQKSPARSVGGHVRSARSPPEFVMAKSVLYVNRMASAVTSPISDSHNRPSPRPQESARGMATLDSPMIVLKIGASWVLRLSISD